MKKNNSKPRKGNYSGKPRKSKEVYDNKEMPNNPNWYAKNPQLLKDTASIPFSNVLGKRLPINSDGIASASVPGIMCIDYAHSLGGGQSATDAPTVAARYIYSYVRHANSGSANYEAPDLYMMIVAWHSANAFIEHAKRAYGTMMHYLARNRFFAETVVRAMGFDYASLMRSLPAFRSAINQASAKLNSIKVPGDMPLGDRWKQLASEYYCDGQSSKAQLYIPNCIEFLKYDGYGSATGTSLVRFEPMPFMDVETWRLAVEQLLAPLLAEEDVGIMSGDIQKAFGDNVSRVSMIDESYYALPIFSNEMLAQIHNLIMPGVHAATPVGHARVYQNAGVIIDDFFIHENNLTMTNQYPYFAQLGTPVILDTKVENPTPEDIITMTRFISSTVGEIQEDPAGLYHVRKVLNSGSEIVTQLRIWYRPTDHDTDESVIDYDILHVGSVKNTTAANGTRYGRVTDQEYAQLATFDWAPRLYVTSYAVNQSILDSVIKALPFGDYENFCTVDQEVIDRMNNLAILSELSSSSHTSIA